MQILCICISINGVYCSVADRQMSHFRASFECIMEGFFRVSYGHKCHQRLRNSVIYIFNALALVLQLRSVRRTLAAFWRFRHLSDLFLCIHFDPFVINFLPAHVGVVALKLLRQFSTHKTELNTWRLHSVAQAYAVAEVSNAEPSAEQFSTGATIPYELEPP